MKTYNITMDRDGPRTVIKADEMKDDHPTFLEFYRVSKNAKVLVGMVSKHLIVSIEIE